MLLKPLKVYHGKFSQARIPVRGNDKQRTATIRRIGSSFYEFRRDQARNEFRRAMIANDEMLSQIAYADIACWVERLDHQ